MFAEISAASPWTELTPATKPTELAGLSLVHYDGRLYLWVPVTTICNLSFLNRVVLVLVVTIKICLCTI